MAAEHSSSPLPPTRKPRKRKIRHQQEQQLERFNSLPWTTALPENETFSLFSGSTELDGGFLSLEEIDESQYGLEIPQPEVFPEVEEENDKVLKKRDRYEEDDDSKSKKKRKKKGKQSIDKLNDAVETSENDDEDEEKKRKVKNDKRKEKENKLKLAKEERSVDGKKKKRDVLAIQKEDAEENGGEEKMKKKGSAKEKGTAKELSVLKEGTLQEDIREEMVIDEDDFYAWNELRLHPVLMKSIYRLGFKDPTPIQKACIPAAAHQGKDVIGAAETGSGKTLAFGIPIIQRLLEERDKKMRLLADKVEEDAANHAQESILRALIITPTRELALQVADHLKQIAVEANIRVVPIVGGLYAEKQERLLKERPEIVVATPGRLWELMSEGKTHLVELHSLSFFILDEADRMVQSGHFHELQSIIDMLPTNSGSSEAPSEASQNCITVGNFQKKKRQTLVFSATIALSSDFRKKLKRGSFGIKDSKSELNSIEVLSERAGMKENAAIINLTNTSVLARKLEESFIECREEDKDAYLYYILSVHGHGRTIVFCTSISALKRISSILSILKVKILNLHADKQQGARLKSIDHFRQDDKGVLIATDVAARGLDIPNVRTVIHYQLPHSADVYVHRSGRTARASADGCSIALISSNDKSNFASLCKSFSKERFLQFPIDLSYMQEIRKRLSLARQIDKVTRAGSEAKSKKNWLKKNAEAIGLDVDENESDDEKANNHKLRKANQIHQKALKQELSVMLSRPLQPASLRPNYLTGAGVSSLLQDQFENLAKDDKFNSSEGKNDKKSKKVGGRHLMVIGKDCVDTVDALRSAGHEVSMDVKEAAGKRRDMETLRRKRREEKKRARDQRRKQKKRLQGKI